MLVPLKKIHEKPRPHIKKQRYYLADKGPSSQNYGFSSSHVWMWELDHKESWALKIWCFWTVVLKTLESPLDYEEIKLVNSKGNQSWRVLLLLSHFSRVRLFPTPWIAACQASLSITNSRSSPKLMSIELVMPSSHSSSVVPFSSCPQSLPASGSFPMSQLFTWGAQVLEF